MLQRTVCFGVISTFAFLYVEEAQSAETVKFQQGVNGYTGTKDLELKGGTIPPDAFPKAGAESVAATAKKRPETPVKPPEHPKSSDRVISVDLDNGGQQSQALIRFDDIIGSEPGKVPSGSIVTAASLTFHATSAGGSRVFIHRLLSDWDPVNLTWDTAKLAGNSDGGIQADNKEAAAPFTTFDSTHKGEFEIDILPVVKLWVSGAQKNHGLALTCDSANGWDFETSESTTVEQRPRLTVTFTAPTAK